MARTHYGFGSKLDTCLSSTRVVTVINATGKCIKLSVRSTALNPLCQAGLCITGPGPPMEDRRRRKDQGWRGTIEWKAGRADARSCGSGRYSDLLPRLLRPPDCVSGGGTGRLEINLFFIFTDRQMLIIE